MGAATASAVKGPAASAQQARVDAAQSAERVQRAPPRRHEVGASASPPSFAAIPAGAPDECGTAADFLYLQRKCSACAAEDDELELRRKPLATAPPAPLPAPEPVLLLQRKCASCAAQEDDETRLHVQRRPLVTAPAHGATPRAAPPPAPFARAQRLVRESLAQSGGSALEPALRRAMEQAYGVDLGAVRVHTDAPAARASDAVAAQAFTLGQSIYFGSGRYQPQTPGGRELLAHELAHVVQNRNGAPPAPTHKRGLALSAPHDPAELEADEAARAAVAGRRFRIRGRGGGVQRKGVLDRVVDWGSTKIEQAESTLESGAKAVVEFTGEQLMKLVRAVAPGLAAIIDEGPVNYAQRKVSEALDAHLPDALGGFSLSDLGKGVSSWLGTAKDFIKGLAQGESGACEKFKGFMHKLTDFVGKLIDNPVVEAITGALGKATDFVGKVLKVIGEPLFEGLKSLIGGAWSVLTKVASTIAGWFNAAKAALGAAWDKLMSLLGFDGSSEDGVWSWIKTQAAKVWDTIKQAVAPVLEPLKKVASVVALLTPLGQIHAIVKYGPKLVKVAKWIWENGLEPDKIREAPEEIRGMLENIGGNVSGFKSTLQSGFDWLSEKLSSLAEAVLSVGSTLSGLPLIGWAHDLFDKAKEVLNDVVSDIKQGAQDALESIESFAGKVAAFVEPYKSVISTLIVAIAAPPTIPLLLAGWAWQKIPRCVKLPILDFVLDIAIKAISVIPGVPTFGILWPLLKPAVLAFLQTLRAASDEVKEAVSNKIAKIISGGSPDFLIGFVKGFAQGVWEGITDPISAIWTVLEGLDTATQYLLSLAGVGDDDKQAVARQPAGGGAEAGGAAAAPAAAAPAAKGGEKNEGFATLSKAPKPAAHAEAAGAPAAHAAAAPAPAPAAAPTAPAQHTATAPPAPAPAPPAKAPAPAAKGAQATVSKSAAPAPDPAPAAAAAPSPAPKTAAAGGERTIAPEADAADTGGPQLDAKNLSKDDVANLAKDAGEAADAIGPDVATVKGNFWGAVQEYFSGSSMTFDQLVERLSEAWEAAKAKIAEGGAWLANQLIGFFQGAGAEGELGDKVGWLTGSIVFQVVLDAITAGTWTEADSILVSIAKFINWPMEALGEAFKLLKKLGKYLVDGLKSLGKAIKEAASGAFKLVSSAISHIAEKLLAFGERILGKFGGKAAKAESKVLGALGKESVEIGEREVTNVVAKDSAKALEEKALADEAKVAKEPEPQLTNEPEPKATKEPEPKATNEPEPKATTEAQPGEGPKPAEATTPAETGHIESDKLSPSQLHGETEMLAEHPGMLEGTPPNRHAKVGEHEWTENPLASGECEFCRHSNKAICIKTPELRAQEATKRVEDAQKLAEARSEQALKARAEAEAAPVLSDADRAAAKKDLTSARRKATAKANEVSKAEAELKAARDAGQVDKAQAAEARLNQANKELDAARAEEDALSGKLTEKDRKLAAADKAEEDAAEAQRKFADAQGNAAQQKHLDQKIDNLKAKKDDILKRIDAQHKAGKVDSKLVAELDATKAEIKQAEADLHAAVEASEGITPEVKEALRKDSPFKGEGGRKRLEEWKAGLPADAKKGGQYVDYVTGEPLPTSRLQIDHITPLDEICKMDGFGRLSRKDQLEILDLKENLAFLESGRNQSKSAQSLTEWLASDKNLAPDISPERFAKLEELEAKARKSVQDEIKKRLEKAMAP